jgi:hypothetical protein
MVALAGDTWDASMLNTEGSGFNRFIDAIREIADLHCCREHAVEALTSMQFFT